MAFYVFDLDGTLADCTHRLHHITGEAKDWRAFFAACPADEPIDHALDLLFDLAQSGNKVEIWSGRSDEVREPTLGWLASQGLPAGVDLVMRKAGDRRSDEVVKREFLSARGRPDIIFDDRARVVRMWRAEGVPCFQVADGNF